MASPNLNEITTTTLRNRSGVLADNITNHNVLLHRLGQKGKIKTVDGGRTIVQEIEYLTNATYKRYSGYDQVNISPSDVFTAAEFNYAQAAVAISISGLEELQNAGREQIIDLLDSRISNAEKTMQNSISSDLYSDGTADSGKQIGGLQAIVADTGLGTVGGISASTWSFWQNTIFSFATNSLTPGPATIQTAMNRTYLSASRGTDRPDLIVADNTYFRYYWESLQSIQRISNDKMAQAGFENLKFMGSDVVFDGGYFGSAPSAHMYMLNSDYLFYRPHRSRNMVPLDPDRFSVNQDAMVKLIAWAGNMTVSNRRLQACIIA